MASFLAVLALAGGVFWLEAPGLIRRKRKRELAVFVVFLLAATALYGALALEVKLPNPFMIIKLVYGGGA
ncbi:hypothetical protein [Paenibacillus arenilitoris]|uniref:Uncharacterized protein n=1 Tax=Paenibacillus arenilitoris TaxID=2772299 RepID=A0A927CRG1_9BACL|nr:hypothetical protein [Paenibacillus arenilitoris]MBD2870566.1 hypothetical protein [Paenibacillus arenilitoris]